MTLLFVCFILIPVLFAILAVLLRRVALLILIYCPKSNFRLWIKRFVRVKPKNLVFYLDASFFTLLIILMISITFYYHFK